MADYYTQFSCIFDVGSAENAARADDILHKMEEEIDEEEDANLGFSMEHDPDTNPGALWIYSDECGEPEHVIKFVLCCAEAMDLTGIWGFTWGLSCSKPRTGAFGGGAQLLDLGKRKSVEWIDCSTWLDERTKLVVDDDASGSVNISNPESPTPAAPGVVAGQEGAA